MLSTDFYNKDACELAKALLGKVIRARYKTYWLSAQITETEAFYRNEKASHSSLGFTEKRRAMFMPAGTIYMYYARGGDSLNISSQGEGDAVLIKAGVPFVDALSPKETISVMQAINPINGRTRPYATLCSGQTLLCKSLNLKVPEWDQQQFDHQRFYIDNVGFKPQSIIQTSRRGIPIGRDEHLPYRFLYVPCRDT